MDRLFYDILVFISFVYISSVHLHPSPSPSHGQITDCFGVPHQEKIDELYVAVNTEYHRSMYKFHNRIYRRDAIVGWYTTTTPSGAQIVDNSSLIHDFYRGECADPVHLVVDTTLSGGM